MKKNVLLLMCLCLSFLGFTQKQVSGLVTDEQGMPIPGVTVLVKNTSTGSVTNFDGLYNIEVPSIMFYKIDENMDLIVEFFLKIAPASEGENE